MKAFLILFSMLGMSTTFAATECPSSFKQDIKQVFDTLALPSIAVTVAKESDYRLCDFTMQSPAIAQNHQLSTDHLFWVASVTKPFTSYLSVKRHENVLRIKTVEHKSGNKTIPPLFELLSQTSEGNTSGKYFVYGGRFNLIEHYYNGLTQFQNDLRSFISAELGLTAFVRVVEVPEDFKIIQPLKRVSNTWVVDDKAKWSDTYPATNLLISSSELARFGMMVNDCKGLTTKQCEAYHQRVILKTGKVSPYGLGQFIDHICDTDVYWQYGLGQAESSLFVRAPSKNLSVAVLSNAKTLSDSSLLGTGNLLRSPIGLAIVNRFICKLPDEDVAFNTRLNTLIAEQRSGALSEDSLDNLESLIVSNRKDLHDSGLPMIWLLASQSSAEFQSEACDLVKVWGDKHGREHPILNNYISDLSCINEL